jgi:hypothetical protein
MLLEKKVQTFSFIFLSPFWLPFPSGKLKYKRMYIHFLYNGAEFSWLPGLPDFSCYKIPKRGEIYQMTTNYTKWPWNISSGRKIGQLVIIYTKIFNFKTLLNLSKLGFLILKQTIWQPWWLPLLLQRNRLHFFWWSKTILFRNQFSNIFNEIIFMIKWTLSNGFEIANCTNYNIHFFTDGQLSL